MKYLDKSLEEDLPEDELETVRRELQRVSSELEIQKQHLDVALNSVGDAVVRVDAGMQIRDMNPAAVRMLECRLSMAVGMPLVDLVWLHSSSGQRITDLFEQVFKTGVAESNETDVELQCRSGTLYVHYTAAAMHAPSGELVGGVLTLRDVSAERSMAQRLHWKAAHDPLTGLINRREFTSGLKQAISVSRSAGRQHTVCFMDLDRFKIVNDSAGHAAGDEFLREVTTVLRVHIRASDSFARLGGDEFALLLMDCPLIAAKAIANNLIAAVSNFHLDVQGKTFTAGISVGLARVTGDADHDEVISMADVACYHAKEQGGNRVSVYEMNDTDLITRRMEISWAGRINAALQEGRFALYHQTYLPLSPEDAETHQMEVLLRMIDESGQLVTPGQFLLAAERHNLMPQIDRMVIGKVFAGYHDLAAKYEGGLTCSINLSGKTLVSSDLFEYVERLFRKYALPPQSICFEITETAAISNLRRASEFIAQCKSLGILFALDDFGTGTSSFRYLKRLSVDYLKIDGSFVRNIDSDDMDHALTQSMNHIGQLLGLKTVAEFAESDAIIDKLRAMGVNYAQGYAVCMPKPLFEMALEKRVGVDEKS